VRPLLAAFAVVLGLTAASASGQQTPASVYGEAVLVVSGRGYGHGVGMSQYGAKGRALAGQTTDEILAHYYQGTTVGSLPLETPIRVRVLKAFTASSGVPLVLYGRGGTWTIDGVAKTFPKDAKVTVTPTSSGGTTTWRVKVTAAGSPVLHDASTASFRMRPDGTATLLQVLICTLEKHAAGKMTSEGGVAASRHCSGTNASCESNRSPRFSVSRRPTVQLSLT